MIGEAIAAALPLMREQAASLRTDTCTIERQSSKWDAENRKTAAVWTPIHTDVPCHVEDSPGTSRSLATDERVTPGTPLVAVDWTFTDIQPDDRVTVPGHDPMWVTSAAHDDATHPVETLIQCRRTR
ncbi:hypothetical protein H9L10_03550 [Phycicoccus endophyticus]|uniref:Uncharacterized protein n=1 Tax=Phycicoccus endophyticus TaxID=1690220 RepID=A0A7G9R3G9_9MICO|nr:DUF6093 family protein [Phycicoccus endophyticus]NHI19900.1 hypothetical protein [Phycicoccus endophyticus]QNN50144.1 hypothetical protein H9L10_03550 [Phycicoccus endophyticus]GGL27649.1 hypothetical protein GCM10012283_07330 [Phycicoccus endophyticus]